MPKRIPRWIQKNWFLIWHVIATLLIVWAIYAVWNSGKQRQKDSRAARVVFCQVSNQKSAFDRKKINRSIIQTKDYLNRQDQGDPKAQAIPRDLLLRSLADAKSDLVELAPLPCHEFSLHPERFVGGR